MTDEEIEKVLTQCGDLSEFDCKGCPLEGNALCFSVMQENALDYINRLKAENAMLRISDDSKEKCTIEQHAEIHRLRDELKQVRKDTVKEIFKLVESVKCGENGMCYRNPDCVIASKIKEKYGVEVDDE